MIKKRVSAIWTIVLVVFFFYLLYQSTFAWNEEVSMPKTSHHLPEDKTAFVMITNNHYGVQHSEIDSLRESLEMWEYDSKKKKISLKHGNQLPTDKTQMMVIYDRGYDSFERHSDVLSLLTFPYEHFYKDESVFKVYGVGSEGDVYMSYKNVRIHLQPGESYHAVSTEGFKLTFTTVKNYGLYDKKQFVLKGTPEEEEQKQTGPQEVNVKTLESKPLAPEPKYDSKPLVENQEEIFMDTQGTNTEDKKDDKKDEKKDDKKSDVEKNEKTDEQNTE